MAVYQRNVPDGAESGKKNIEPPPFRDIPSSEFVPPLGTGDLPPLDDAAVAELISKAMEVEPEDVQRANEVLREYRTGARNIPLDAVVEMSAALAEVLKDGDGSALKSASAAKLARASSELTEAMSESGWSGSDPAARAGRG